MLYLSVSVLVKNGVNILSFDNAPTTNVNCTTISDRAFPSVACNGANSISPGIISES